MKKILLSLALVAGISLSASAQEKSKDCKCDCKCKAPKELNLTQEQKDKIKTLSEAYKVKGDELRGQQRELRKKYNQDVNALLSPEQQEAWKDRFEKRGPKNHRGNKHFGDRSRSGKRMNLDSETKAKLDELKSNFEKEKSAIEKTRIAPEVQKQRIQTLEEKYRNDRKEIMKSVAPKKGRKNAA